MPLSNNSRPACESCVASLAERIFLRSLEMLTREDESFGKAAQGNAMQDVRLYVELKDCVEVKGNEVQLGHVAQVYAEDQKVETKAKEMVIYKRRPLRQEDALSTLRDNKQVAYQGISMIYILQCIHKEFHKMDIQCIGATEVLVKFLPKSLEAEKERKGVLWAKVKEKIVIYLVCHLCFFGSAFTIMAFHNDIGIQELFAGIYYRFTGTRSDGFTALEVAYSIGLATGIVVFFNHFGKRKFSGDPTPVEVEMKTYETDIDKTILENSNRKGETL